MVAEVGMSRTDEGAGRVVMLRCITTVAGKVATVMSAWREMGTHIRRMHPLYDLIWVVHSGRMC